MCHFSNISYSYLNDGNVNSKFSQYTCINASLCSKHLTNEQKIPEGTEVKRTLQQVDIQVFEDLIPEIYIPPTLVCNLMNYVGIF